MRSFYAYFTVICFVLCAADRPYAAPPDTVVQPSVGAALPDTALNTRVTVDVAGMPLRDALQVVSKQSPVTLTAARDLAEYRVSIIATNQPLRVVMARLVRLLSHSEESSPGYFWTRLDRETLSYRLDWDTNAKRRQREELLQYREQALQSLRDLHQLLKIESEEERVAFSSAWSETVKRKIKKNRLAQIVSLLPDKQLRQLVNGQRVALPIKPRPEYLAWLRERYIQQKEEVRATHLRLGGPDPFPNGLPEMPAIEPYAIVRPITERGDKPHLFMAYGINLRGVEGEGGWDYLTGFDLFSQVSVFSLPPGVTNPKIDLTLYFKDATKEQKSDSAFALRALGKAAGLNIYQEHFIKTDNFGYRPSEFTHLAGTLAEVLDAICRKWGYRCAVVDGDYVLTSLHRSFYRSVDVPEATIARWRAHYRDQKTRTWRDDAALARELTFPQIKVTLRTVVPEIGSWGYLRGYHALRFMARLTEAQRQQAVRPEGLPVSGLSAGQLSGMSQELNFADYADQFSSTRQPPGAAVLMASRLHMTTIPATGDLAGLRVVAPDGTTLWSVLPGF